MWESFLLYTENPGVKESIFFFALTLLQVYFYGWSTYARKSYMGPLAAHKGQVVLYFLFLFLGFGFIHVYLEAIIVALFLYVPLLWMIYYIGYFCSYSFIALRRYLINTYYGITDYEQIGNLNVSKLSESSLQKSESKSTRKADFLGDRVLQKARERMGNTIEPDKYLLN